MNPFITHMFQSAPIATNAAGDIYCIRTGAILIPASADFDDPATALSLANQIIDISQQLASATPIYPTGAEQQAAFAQTLTQDYEHIGSQIATLATEQPKPVNAFCPPLAEFRQLAIRDSALNLLGMRPMPPTERATPPFSIYSLRWWLQDDSNPMMPGSRPKRAVDYDIDPELLAHIHSQFAPGPTWDQKLDQRINAFLSRFPILSSFLRHWDAHLNNWWNRCEARLQNWLGNPMAVPPPINDTSRYQLQAGPDQAHLQLSSTPRRYQTQITAHHHHQLTTDAAASRPSATARRG